MGVCLYVSALLPLPLRTKTFNPHPQREYALQEG